MTTPEITITIKIDQRGAIIEGTTIPIGVVGLRSVYKGTDFPQRVESAVLKMTKALLLRILNQ